MSCGKRSFSQQNQVAVLVFLHRCLGLWLPQLHAMPGPGTKQKQVPALEEHTVITNKS